MIPTKANALIKKSKSLDDAITTLSLAIIQLNEYCLRKPLDEQAKASLKELVLIQDNLIERLRLSP